MDNPTFPIALAALKKAKVANERIDALPLPMVFKGSLGTGGTISTLPTASSENEGFVYIVITDGTYAGQAAKAGDTFVSDGSVWVLVPSADEPSPIDDSVTSTALTWSSDKISKECKIKSFKYTGTGSGFNKIQLPNDCKIITSIYGNSNTYGVGLIGRYINLSEDLSGGYAVVVQQYGVSTTLGSGSLIYNSATNELTISSGAVYRAFNELDVTYTVYYI